MKSFLQHVSDTENLTDLTEGINGFAMKAASVAILLRMRNQLGAVKSQEGKALASGLLSLASLITLAQFSIPQNQK